MSDTLHADTPLAVSSDLCDLSALTLLELQRTSRSLRVLSDYLQQHPDSLLRGKPADPPLPAPTR